MSGVALVTGANGGIGTALVDALLGDGWTVLAGVRDPRRWSASQAPDAIVVTLDVTTEGCVADALDGTGIDAVDIDLLVNNAGVAVMGTCEEADLRSVRDVFEVNLFGAMGCTQEVLPGMIERGGGTVVNVSSIAGIMTTPGQVAYCTSKWALEAYTECLFQEVHRFGVRVVLLEPGITPTPIFGKQEFPPSTRYTVGYEQLLALVLRGLGSGSSVNDVALAVLAAVGDDAGALRHPCSWGAPSIQRSWGRLTHDQLARIASSADAAEYLALLEQFVGLPAADPTLTS